MEIIRGIHNIGPQHHGCVATIGKFDGVHHGHRMLLAHLNAKRDELRVPSILITFEPLPREFFEGSNRPARLTRFREKIELLCKTGVDRVLCLPFNEQLRSVDAETVIEDFLVNRLGVRYLVVGDNFQFGRDREGDYAMLKEAGDRYGFGVSHLGTLRFDHERVSSTRVREVLKTGNFELAERLLGHEYFIMGRVMYGRQLGRQLGIPTANVPLHRYRAALEGVYAVEVEGLGETCRGVANIGVRPTVQGKEPRLEVHIFDFDRDIYGQLIRVVFKHKIREEQQFDSLDELKAHIEGDIDTARRWFAAQDAG